MLRLPVVVTVVTVFVGLNCSLGPSRWLVTEVDEVPLGDEVLTNEAEGVPEALTLA